MKRLVTAILLILVIPSAAMFKGILMADKMKFYCDAQWELNEAAADTTVEDSVKDHDGTANKNTEDMNAVGKIEGALDFNGVNDDVNFTPTDFPSGNSPRSLSLWCYSDGVGDADCLFVYGSTDSNGLFGLSFYDYNYMAIPIRYSGTPSTVHEFTGVSWVDLQNKWVHFVLTFDGNYFRLYVNGELGWTSSETFVLNTGTVRGKIGTAWAGQYPFNGKIDNIQIYRKTLNQDEVNWLWKGGNGRVIE